MKKKIIAVVTLAAVFSSAAGVFAVSEDVYSTQIPTLTTALEQMSESDKEEFISVNLDIKSQNFRGLLGQLYDKAHNGMDKFDGINEIMGLAEKCML